MIQKDVLIVGGGPAGTACAWKLKEYGISPLILDKEKFPREKLCAGWITPHVFHLLKDVPGNYPYGLTRFSSFRITVKQSHFTLPVNQFAIRRYEFDNWLLKRSEAEIHSHQVKEIKHENGAYIIDDMYAAPILIGAGGTYCPVRKYLTPWDDQDQENLIVAVEQEFPYSYTDNRCHLWFLQNGLPGYSWYVPKSGEYLNIGIGGKAAKLKEKSSSIREHWNLFIEQLQNLGLVDGDTFHPWGHSYYLNHKSHETHRDGIYLIGDAAGLATKDMGEGIGPAIQSGILAAKSIAQKKFYKLSSIPKYSFPSILKIRK